MVKAESLDPIVRMCIKKLANAAKNALAIRMTMLGENEELFKQNCEKEVRVHSGNESGQH